MTAGAWRLNVGYGGIPFAGKAVVGVRLSYDSMGFGASRVALSPL